MATQALDVVTILYALGTLGRELKITSWTPITPTHSDVFTWLVTFKKQLARITGQEAKASRFYEELNAFLVQRGFRPLVTRFDPKTGLGVVSILDKLVRWLNGPGEICTIFTPKGLKPGFELPSQSVDIYEVKGYPASSLLRLRTQSADTLWIFVHPDTSREGLDLVKLSMDVMRQPRKTPMSSHPSWQGEKWPTWAGAQIPMIDFDITSDLRWLLGTQATTTSGYGYFITQATQQFKMRMDETGARARVATVVGVAQSVVPLGPMLFVIDRPFYGWWTQPGIDLPMAAFFADWDCWRTPAGSLENSQGIMPPKSRLNI